MRNIVVFLVLFLTAPAWAVEIEGVDVPDSVKVEGKELRLHGAGVRTKFFFDIYIGALYLSSKASTVEEILDMPNPKRFTMTFLYDEVSKDKLVGGWNSGFEKNQSKEAMWKLKERLDKFNTMFADTHKGERYTFDFLKDGNTVVAFGAEKIGVIEGTDFQQALLMVWLGSHPAHEGLKESLLGGSE